MDEENDIQQENKVWRKRGGNIQNNGNLGCFDGRHLMRRIFPSYRKLFISSYSSSSSSALSHRTVQTFLIFCYCPFLIYASMIAALPPVGANIDCFKCSSLNGDNPSCEDPFHNNYSTTTLEAPCMGGRKGREGLFPATACIKMAGVFVDTGETIVIRGCSLDSGTLNTDTEIIRMSHCGHFYFEDRYVKGCLKSCEDTDACNHSNRPILSKLLLLVILLQVCISNSYQIQVFHCNLL